MRRDTAASRARAGQTNGTAVRLERPDTQVRGPDGTVFSLPRRQADAEVVVYRKVNANAVDPVSGARRRGSRAVPSAGSGRARTLGFGTLALTAFVGVRACQLLVRCLRRRRRQHDEQEQQELALQAALEQRQQAALPPPVHVLPAMLRRALPQLGPPRRVKQLAAQHHARRRSAPSARSKMQAQGVAQRKQTTLEKWEAAVRRQAHALVVREQQQQQPLLGAAGSVQPLDCGRAPVLPLPGLPGSSLAHPQPLIEVAEAPPAP